MLEVKGCDVDVEEKAMNMRETHLLTPSICGDEVKGTPHSQSYLIKNVCNDRVAVLLVLLFAFDQVKVLNGFAKEGNNWSKDNTW